MPHFIVTTSKGLGRALEEELRGLGLKVVAVGDSSVTIDGPWRDCYQVNYQSRVAVRVLRPLLEFQAYSYDELFAGVLNKTDFTKYLEVHNTFKVDAKVSDSRLADQRLVALKVKDAIADQFSRKFKCRPDVDRRDPDLNVVVRVRRSQVLIALDTSGESLSKRGWRSEAVEAPLAEHLAAGLLRLARWSPQITLIDPMCGSGTFLIEAAKLALGHLPRGKRTYSFEHWKNYQAEDLGPKEFLSEADSPKACINLFGFDQSSQAIALAQANSRRAGVANCIQFRQQPIEDLKSPAASGVIVTNPPYGVRMSDDQQAKDNLASFARVLKKEFFGWDVWMLSGAGDLTANWGLKSAQKHRVYNGPIECRFLNYQILPPLVGGRG